MLVLGVRGLVDGPEECCSPVKKRFGSCFVLLSMYSFCRSCSVVTMYACSHRPSPICRRYRRSDALAVAKLFHETVHGVNRRNYSQAQCEVWAPTYGRDAFFFHKRLNHAEVAVVAEVVDQVKQSLRQLAMEMRLCSDCSILFVCRCVWDNGNHKISFLTIDFPVDRWLALQV